MAKIVIPFKPHKFQQEIFKNLKRFSVLVCHRRFGKTVLCVNLLIRWALSDKRRAWRGAYIAPLFRQAKSIAWDYLVYYTHDIPGVKLFSQELRADFPNGSRIMLLGSDNPDSLRGIYLDAAILDEYADIKPQVYSLIISPAITDRKGRVIWMGAPRGHNAFPNPSPQSVCMECKRQGTVCVWWRTGRRAWVPSRTPGAARSAPRTTVAASAASAPRSQPTAALATAWQELGASPVDLVRGFRNFNAYAEAFRRESEAHER